MSTTDLGYYGEKKNLLIRQGATLGPFVCTMTYDDDSPYDLTGKTIRGKVRNKSTRALLATIEVTYPNRSLGQYTWGLTAAVTATIPVGEKPKDDDSLHEYDLEMEDDATGVVTPLYYGDCPTLRENTY